MLDAADRLVIQGFRALIAFDRWAIQTVGHAATTRVLPAVDRLLRRDRSGRRR